METLDFFVYGLIDPRTGSIRYVGKTAKGLVRPNDHFKIAWRKSRDGSWKCSYHVYAWIRSMGGLKPNVVILERAQTEDELNALESDEIKRLAGLGYRLTNHTNGGDGVSGLTHSEETKERLRRLMLGSKRPQQSGDKHWTRRLDTKPGPHPRHVICLNDGREFPSGKDAAREYGLSNAVVNRALHGHPNRRGLRFEYR